jgi:P4 family phage/plasmid primase-like protien
MNPMPHHAPLRYLSKDMWSVIPADLRDLAQWITWQAGAVQADGKFAKFPKGRDGSGDEWQKPAQWMPLEEAIETARRRRHSGVGLVLPAQTPEGKHVVALDFDSVDLKDQNTLRIQEIRTLHERLGNPYIEESPSGKGLRIFLRSDRLLEQISVANPLGGKDELFCASSKWVTVTGFKRGGSDMPDATVELEALAQQWRARAPQKPKQASYKVTHGPTLGHLTGGWSGWPGTKLRDGDGREEMMLRYAGHLRANGLSQANIERLCLEANQAHYEDRLDENTVLDRARRYQSQDVSQEPPAADDVLTKVDQTDAGNVAQLYEITQGDLRYVYESDVWIGWKGCRWEYDRSRSILHKQSLGVAKTYEGKAKSIQALIDDPATSDEQRKALKEALRSLQKWISQCRDRKRLDAMVALAQKDPRFVIFASELDRDPCLLGVANGVVCLRTGTLRPDSRSEYILRRSPIDFNPAASTLNFAHFIAEVTCCPDGFEDGKVKPKARPTLARHLQKVGGYCLTGEVKEQVLFMLCGTGANGKSLFVDLLREVLGDYGEVIQPEILLAAKGSASAEQASPSTRKLAGARCAITSESKEGAKLDVAVVKRHTGDSKMTARGLYERPITFDITHKLVLLTNHPPRVDHMDDAIKGRIQVIPFDMRWNRPSTTEYDPTLPDADKDLFAKLKADAEGVLLYLVQGAVLYFQEGLTPPSEVKAFTQNYIASQDTVRRWVAECEGCPIEEGLTAKQLLESYREYCAGEGEVVQVETAEALGRRLVQLGHKSRRTRVGSQYGLKPKVLPDLLGFEIIVASGQQQAVM